MQPYAHGSSVEYEWNGPIPMASDAHEIMEITKQWLAHTTNGRDGSPEFDAHAESLETRIEQAITSIVDARIKSKIPEIAAAIAKRQKGLGI